MILDATLLFGEDQAITATALSTNVLDFGTNGTVYGESAPIVRNLGTGAHIPLLIQVTEDFATLTSLTITVETSDNEDMSSSDVLASSGAIPAATLVAGHRPTFTRVLPDGTMKRYTALRYTVGGSNATAGKITASLATEVNT